MGLAERRKDKVRRRLFVKAEVVHLFFRKNKPLDPKEIAARLNVRPRFAETIICLFKKVF